MNVDVKYFQLTNIVITNEVLERMMENLLLVEKNLREKHVQTATIIRKQSAGMVRYRCYHLSTMSSAKFEEQKTNNVLTSKKKIIIINCFNPLSAFCY